MLLFVGLRYRSMVLVRLRGATAEAQEGGRQPGRRGNSRHEGHHQELYLRSGSYKFLNFNNVQYSAYGMLHYDIGVTVFLS